MAKEIQPTIKPWKYEDSVEIGKKLIGLHHKVTLNLMRELYAANQAPLRVRTPRRKGMGKLQKFIEIALAIASIIFVTLCIDLSAILIIGILRFALAVFSL